MKVNMKELDELRQKWYNLEEKTSEALQAYIGRLDELGMFCDKCGETDPKHGFYPLQSYGMDEHGRSKGHTGYLCNKCGRTPEQYKEMFVED